MAIRVSVACLFCIAVWGLSTVSEHQRALVALVKECTSVGDLQAGGRALEERIRLSPLPEEPLQVQKERSWMLKCRASVTYRCWKREPNVNRTYFIRAARDRIALYSLLDPKRQNRKSVERTITDLETWGSDC